MADAPADLEIRLLRPDDDPGAQLDLSERAFAPGGRRARGHLRPRVPRRDLTPYMLDAF